MLGKVHGHGRPSGTRSRAFLRRKTVPSVSRGPGLPASLPRGSSPGRAPFSAVFSGHKCCIVRIFLSTGSSGGPRGGGLMGRRKVLPGPLPVTEPGSGSPARRAEPSLPPHLLFLENSVRSQENGRTPRAILLGLGLPPGVEPARRPRPVLPVRRSGTCLCLRRGLSTSPVPLPQ